MKTEKKDSSKFLKIIFGYIAVKVYKKRNNIQATYRNLKRLKPIYDKRSSYHYNLFNLAYKQKMWKQSLDHINTAIDRSSDKSVDFNFYLCKANALIHLNEPSESITYLKKYLKAKPDDIAAFRKLGNQFYKLGQWNDAVDSFKSYLKKYPDDSRISFRLAESYNNLKNYTQAEEYYKQTTKNLDSKSGQQKLAVSYYKLGLMKLKNNKNEQANKSFDKAIDLDKKLKSKTLGIGAFHEHYNQLEYAKDAYKNQLLEASENPELYSRLGSLLEEDKLEEAIVYYEKLLEIDKTQSKWHYALANCYEKMKDYHNASILYQSAIDRDLNHTPNTYRRLGFVLDQMGESKKALEAYKNADLFAKPNNVKQNIYKKNISKLNVRYGISYKHYSVRNKMIFYESMSGGRMMGNPFAIFEHIINDEKFQDYTHVWSVNSYQVIPPRYRAKENILFVKRGTDAYSKYISSANYLICNSTLAPYVVRKPDQLYLQTSHGIFYKTVGRDSANTPNGVAGATRNLLQATHIIVPNEYMAEKQPKSYSIKGIHSGEIAKIGYPRIDVTVDLSEKVKQDIIYKLGIDESKKIVFYAPTWRGDSKANNRFDADQLINDLKRLATLDVNVVFRGHPITNSLLKDVNLPKNILVPTPDIQTNELLGMSDILISDYSSVFFDFIVTERPIIHYLYDKEIYTKERGLNLQDSELPGPIAKTSEQLIEIIEEKLQNDKPDSKYLKAKERFSPYDDGKSTERIVNWFFYNKTKNIEFIEKNKSQQSYLFLGESLNEVDIANLVEKLNRLKDDNTVSLMLIKQVEKDKEKMEKLSKLNPEINRLMHNKNMPLTIEEVNAIDYFNKNERFSNDQMKNTYKAAFERQARRLFGDTHFDEVINCAGNSNYWSSLREGVLFRNENK